MKYTNGPATLYNAWNDPETKRTLYLPTVLRDVKWQGASASKTDMKGLSPSDAATSLTSVIIWPSRLRTGGKEYAPPKIYAKLPAAEVRNHWTLSDGQDRLVKGVVEPLEDITDIQDITGMHDDAIKIVSVTTNDYGPVAMQHWYVTGLGA